MPRVEATASSRLSRVHNRAGGLMSVDATRCASIKADPLAIKRVRFNHLPDFAQLSHSHLWKPLQHPQRAITVPQRTQRKFRDDEGMHRNVTVAQLCAHLRLIRAKMPDPDAGVCQNQS